MLRIKKRFHSVVDTEASDSDAALKKHLLSIKGIRNSRLNRHEKEYQTKLTQLNASREVLSYHEKALENAKENLMEGTESLMNQYLNTSTTMNHLQEWAGKEESLKKVVSVASNDRYDSAKKVEEDKDLVLAAKKQYQKTLLSIEKIDIFMEDVESHTSA